MTRFVIAARSRPEINLPHYLGMYEFSVVPRSLFTADGSLHQSNDKSVVAAEIRKVVDSDQEIVVTSSTEGVESQDEKKVIIFDGMAVVNKIDIKKSQIKTCKDFADTFVSIIKHEAVGYQEVRLVFDRYEKASLKANTREKRTQGLSVQYKVTDETQIKHLTTKQFLSSIYTKNELTVYISQKLAAKINTDYVIVYGHTCVTNIADLDPDLKTYNQEEADTGIVLHALDVSRRNPFSELVISCSDTDVLLILLNYFEELCVSTVFKTTQHTINLRLVYEALGADLCKALLGFHALTGCDQTGKFYGFSKLACWKALTSSPPETIQALQCLGVEINEQSSLGLE